MGSSSDGGDGREAEIRSSEWQEKQHRQTTVKTQLKTKNMTMSDF